MELAPMRLRSSDDAGQLWVEFGGYSSAGKKLRNEDAFAAHQPPAAIRHIKGAVACIADGAGCSENAQLASRTSVELFVSDYYSTPDSWPVKIAVGRVLSALNTWLFHHNHQSAAPQDALVTTFSALVFKSNSAHIFHAGDSRVWRYREGQLELLTRDHHCAQRNGVAFLTRALGIDSRLEVDYLTEGLRTGDVFALSTDGLHQTLSQNEIAEFIKVSSSENLEELSRSLVAEALRKGSEDNVSCLLARIVNLPVEDIDEVHRRLTYLAIPPVLQGGHRIDGLVVKKVLHSGTRSHVYLVEDEENRKVYALKAPSENFAQDPAYLDGFIRESWIGARIDHAAVMKTFPRPERSPFLYLLCEYIEGQTLRQWLFDHPVPSLESVRNLLREIISALRAFQRLHMVHRDLKPENIMVCADETIRIIDFGAVHVSGLEESGTSRLEEAPVGAANYIAPEYLSGASGAHVSDIFSIGVIAYEMLTGALPFKVLENPGQRHGKRHYRYISARDRRADLPVWIDLALRKASHPQPEQRYQALSEFMHDFCVPNAEMLGSQRSAPMLERDPVGFWRGVALLLLVIVLLQCFFLTC